MTLLLARAAVGGDQGCVLNGMRVLERVLFPLVSAFVHQSPTLSPQTSLTRGFRVIPGDLVTFDNSRLLHGRKSYVSSPDRVRHLEGAYLDWDEVMSRLRILRRSVHGDA